MIATGIAPVVMLDWWMKVGLNSISQDYGIIRSFPYYICIVSLLGRAELLYEAVAFIKNMHFLLLVGCIGTLRVSF